MENHMDNEMKLALGSGICKVWNKRLAHENRPWRYFLP